MNQKRKVMVDGGDVRIATRVLRHMTGMHPGHTVEVSGETVEQTYHGLIKLTNLTTTGFACSASTMITPSLLLFDHLMQPIDCGSNKHAFWTTMMTISYL